MMNRELDGERRRKKVRVKGETQESASIPRICILGGGFGGLYTALYLRRFPWLNSQNYQITLVEQKDHFVFTPLLYELVTGELQPWEITPSFDKLLANRDIEFCQGKIQGVDLKQRLVRVETPELESREIGYDYLVLAVGGENRLDGVPGAVTHALPFRNLADARLLKERLRWLEASEKPMIRVAIAGGGPSGVELACKLADRLQARGHVLLIERGNQILKNFAPAVRSAAYRALKARQVQVELNTSIDAIAADEISLRRGHQSLPLAADLVLWTAGTRSIEWVQSLGCQQNSQGQLLVLPTLQLMEHPEVFALGDLAEIRDGSRGRVPATAQAAFQQAACAASNLRAAITGRPLRRFRYLHLGDMLTLGTKAAVVSSFGMNLEGRLACLTRKLVYLQRLPTLRHRLQVLKHWIVCWFSKVVSRGRQQPNRRFSRSSSRRQQLLANDSQRGHY